MRRGLVAIALATGCGGGSGLDIEVHAGSEAFDSVELWLAYNTCQRSDGTACDSIAWPNAPKATLGQVLTLGEDEKVFTVPVTDGVGQLHLETPAGTENPIAMAVVGFSGTDVVGIAVISDAIRLHSQEHWIINLDDVGQVTTNRSANPGDGPTHNALVWARLPSSTLADTTGYTGCLAYQEWDGSQWQSRFFVPTSDTDCDGDPKDCNLYAYNAPLATQPNTHCSTRGPTNTAFAHACVVGAPTCPREEAALVCAPNTPLVCIPDAICSLCPDLDAGVCLKTDVTDRLAMQDDVIPLQKCTMEIDAAANNGPCVNNGQAAWAVQFFIPGNICNSSGSTGFIAALRPLGMPFSGGGDVLQLSNGASVRIDGSPVVTPESGCLVDITWGDTPGAASPGPVAALVAVNYSGTHIVFPVIFNFTTPTACPTNQVPAPCEPSGKWPAPGGTVADTMFDCANGG